MTIPFEKGMLRTVVHFKKFLYSNENLAACSGSKSLKNNFY